MEEEPAMHLGERDWARTLAAGALALAAISMVVPASPLRACIGLRTDESVPMKDVPEAVRTAAGKALGSLDDCKASKEKEHGKIRWEIEKPSEGGLTAMILSEAGDVMEVERPVAADKLPKAVRDAIAQSYPKATNVVAESLETHAFELTLMVDGKKHHVKVDFDGAMPGAAKPAGEKDKGGKTDAKKKTEEDDGDDDDDDEEDEGGK
jgi:hypothetical protein